MARRTSKAEERLLLLVLVVGLPISMAGKLIDSIGWVWPVIAIAGIVALFAWYRWKSAKDRRSYLQQKYQDDEIVRKIMSGRYWQGQTQEQLIDSIGHPLAVDNKMLKRSVREVWKYNSIGKNRYALRITLENGFVTGWDSKA